MTSPIPDLLTASAVGDQLTGSPTVDQLATAGLEDRTIAGLVLPYGPGGSTSIGVVTASVGSVRLPPDLSRVKLLSGHSTDPAGAVPVGVAVSADETEDGLRMTFRVGSTAAGDTALLEASEGLRDGLSVELFGPRLDARRHLTDGLITAVSLVPVPAFEDARVTAGREDTETDGDPAEDDTENESGDTMPQDQAARNAGDNASAEKHGGTDGTASTSSTGETGETGELTAAQAAGLTAGQAGRIVTGNRPLSLAQATDAIASLVAGTPDATAALEDITSSGVLSALAPAWLGELWSGIPFTREVVPTFSPGVLRGRKAHGWRWVTKPTVADYAGDKTDVPSNPVATEAVEVEAKRLAGAHDIDRAFWDFGDTEVINGYFAAMTQSYAIESDDRAARFAVASAAGNTLEAQPDLIHAAAKARQAIKLATRTEATTYLVHPDDAFGLLAITTLDNPAYLDLLGVDPSKFLTSDQAKKGSVIAYAKPAMTFFELSGSPIRVQAEHIAKGGRDAALFGYYATLLNDQRGVVEVPIAPAAG